MRQRPIKANPVFQIENPVVRNLFRERSIGKNVFPEERKKFLLAFILV